jgi:hypothetical protein
MTLARRGLLRFGAAALVGAALPMGHKPASLAAESGNTVDVLDRHEAANPVTFRGSIGLFGRSHAGDSRLLCRYLHVRGFADGALTPMNESERWS